MLKQLNLKINDDFKTFYPKTDVKHLNQKINHLQQNDFAKQYQKNKQTQKVHKYQNNINNPNVIQEIYMKKKQQIKFNPIPNQKLTIFDVDQKNPNLLDDDQPFQEYNKNDNFFRSQNFNLNKQISPFDRNFTTQNQFPTVSKDQNQRYKFFQEIKITQNRFFSQLKVQKGNNEKQLQNKKKQMKLKKHNDKHNFMLTMPELNKTEQATVGNIFKIKVISFNQIINEFKMKTSSKIILDRVLLSLDINPYQKVSKITKEKDNLIKAALNIQDEPIQVQIRFLKNFFQVDHKLVLKQQEFQMILKYLTNKQEIQQQEKLYNYYINTFKKNGCYVGDYIDVEILEQTLKENTSMALNLINLIIISNCQ